MKVKNKKYNDTNIVLGSVVLDDMMMSGIETIIYRQEDNSRINKIVVFPMIKIGASKMDIKKINSKKDLYELLYEVEELENLKDIEYIRVNRAFTPLDMEITAATHGQEDFIYQHFMIEMKTKEENSALLDIIVSAAEESLFLRGFEYIVYIKDVLDKGIKEVHIIVNNVSLRGEYLNRRMEQKDDFIKLVEENVTI